MKYLTYDETLGIVEDFMQKSGIAKFCRESCKGACCGGCYTSKRACHLPKNEGGRRIACTAFICGDLFDLVGLHWKTDLRGHWLTAKAKINSAVIPHIYKRMLRVDPNPYYDPPKVAELREHFKVLESDVTIFFNEAVAAEIYDKISKLRGSFRFHGKIVDVFA